MAKQPKAFHVCCDFWLLLDVTKCYKNSSPCTQQIQKMLVVRKTPNNACYKLKENFKPGCVRFNLPLAGLRTSRTGTPILLPSVRRSTKKKLTSYIEEHIHRKKCYSNPGLKVKNSICGSKFLTAGSPRLGLLAFLCTKQLAKKSLYCGCSLNGTVCSEGKNFGHHEAWATAGK